MESGGPSIISTQLGGGNGHWSVSIGLERIGRKLYGLTSVLSNKIVIPIRAGFFDIKTNSRNMCPRIFEVK